MPDFVMQRRGFIGPALRFIHVALPLFRYPKALRVPGQTGFFMRRMSIPYQNRTASKDPKAPAAKAQAGSESFATATYSVIPSDRENGIRAIDITRVRNP